MFDNISINELKKELIFKFIFQLLLAPIVLGLLANIIFFICIWIVEKSFYDTVNVFFVTEPIAMAMGFILSFGSNLGNILSVPTFIKLILDCKCKNESCIENKISIVKILPNYETHGLLEKKRFMCDTFSRKKNLELFIYDKDNTKYRLFWNEKYGSFQEGEIFNCKELTLTYLKRSKIIVDISSILV